MEKPPVLVAEILSPSTALKDRNTKFQLYQSEGVLYYLILDTEKKGLEIYKIENGRYVLQNNYGNTQAAFHLTPECTIEISVKEIWS